MSKQLVRLTSLLIIPLASHSDFQDNLELTVSTSGKEDECFDFTNDDLSGTICIPGQSLDSGDDCPTFVSSLEYYYSSTIIAD